MTVLEKLEKRKQNADSHLEAFKNCPDALPVYRRVCEQISAWSYLIALSQAPLTMNPSKISAHFNLVKEFLIEISATEEEINTVKSVSDNFLSCLLNGKITTVSSYAVELCGWIPKNVPLSFRNETIELTKGVQ